MGVDVVMGVLLPEKPDPELIEQFKAFCESRYVTQRKSDRRDARLIEVEFGKYSGMWEVSLWTLDRYYGFDYERGPWPQIYGCWRAFETFWPGQVRYGGDTNSLHELPIFTAEDAEDVWRYWARQRLPDKSALMSVDHKHDYIYSWSTFTDNWDGYGAKATTEVARRLALAVAPHMHRIDPDMLAFPTSDGGVLWESDDNLLAIPPDGSAPWVDFLLGAVNP